MQLTLILIAALVVAAIGALVVAGWRWRVRQAAFNARMQAARLPWSGGRYDASELASLPPPVQRYFRLVLQDGQSMVRSVSLAQKGKFRLDEHRDIWQPFHATQFITITPPGFNWDACIRMAPGVQVFVRDAYAGGVGSLHASLLGLLTVADMRDTPDIARGELMRYLAEAPWYPTALLPGQGVQWQAVDASTARATLSHAGTTVSLEFGFDAQGCITSAWSPSRPRSASESAPWLCRFSDYAERGAMRIPLQGEVEWQLPGGPLPYWRGRLTDIDYEWESTTSGGRLR